MATFEDVALEALRQARTDVARNRRAVIVAIAVLALIHLLTVGPYLRISREAAVVEDEIAASEIVAAKLTQQIETLADVQASAKRELEDLLQSATARMISDFGLLRPTVSRGLEGDVTPADSPGEPREPPADTTSQVALPPSAPLGQAGGPDVSQLPPMQQMQMPMQQMPMQQMQQIQLPAPSSETGPQSSSPDLSEALTPTWPLDAELEAILADMRAREPEALDRLAGYARSRIVEPAYTQANRQWTDRVRPKVIAAMESAGAVVGELAASRPQAGDALDQAAEAIGEAKAAFEAVDISPDNTVDAALGSDWWSTTTDKARYADAVSQSVAEQLQVDQVLSGPLDQIQGILEEQEALRDAALAARERMEAQFADQRQQLSSLAGISGFVPIDLTTFIGLFPMVLGLVVGIMMLRLAETRREAAAAAGELQAAGVGDRSMLHWLVARAAGGSISRSLTLETSIVGVLSLAWIVLAALQVRESPVTVPVAPAVGAVIGGAVVVVAVVRDELASRQLRRIREALESP